MTEHNGDARTLHGVTNIRFNYVYRDASNYKAYGDVVFTGNTCGNTDSTAAIRADSPLDDITHTLDSAPDSAGNADGDSVRADLLGDRVHQQFRQLMDSLPTDSTGARLFIPEQVGLPSLRYELPGYYEDDTDWHEPRSVELTSDPPTQDESFEQFVSRCLAVRRWDPDPRIRHHTVIFDAGFHTRVHAGSSSGSVTVAGSNGGCPPGTPSWVPQLADRWFAWGADTWIAVGPDADEEAWFAGLRRPGSPEAAGRLNAAAQLDEAEGDVFPQPRVRPIDDIPALGRLVYRELIPAASAASPSFVETAIPTPGQVVITAEKIRGWSGHALDAAQLHRLAEAIQHSSIPDALATIVRSLLNASP